MEKNPNDKNLETSDNKYHVKVAHSFVDWIEAGNPTEYYDFNSYREALNFFEQESTKFPKDKQGGVMMYINEPNGKVRVIHVRGREWNTDKKWRFNDDTGKVSL